MCSVSSPCNSFCSQELHTYSLSFSIPSKIKISMQFDVLQLLRNALPSHFWKHLVACFVCIFISMRKDLRHPYMCSPLPDISYTFSIFLSWLQTFICILEMNLPAFTGTWYAWWRIVLRKRARFRVRSQSLKSREESHHIDSPALKMRQCQS